MKTILVPVDFSKCSMDALEYAASLAKKTGSRVHILNITQEAKYYFIADPAAYALPYGDINKMYEEIKKSVNKKLAAAGSKKFMKGVEFYPKAIIGGALHIEIISYAEKIKAGIIIMGSHGAEGFGGILLGSTSERVVRFSKLPVIVISRRVIDTDFKLIVFASDFKEEAYNVFPAVKTFAKITNATIHLLKVNTTDRFSRTIDNEKLIGAFNKHFKSSYKAAIYDDYMKEEGILNYSDFVKADMIAIGTHGKKGFARFFRSDISEGIVRLAHKPIIVVNFGKK